MPRPNKQWERKYGKKPEQKKHLLSGLDDILSAAEKLACGAKEANTIILMALRHSEEPFMRLLDMDDMQMHGQRIVRAFYEWSKHDYDVLIKGIAVRDESLIRFINSIPINDKA